ncbi:MAG: AhpC/TSA family protein [Bacteroidales bacterium]|nr:AhpC/TSA family protein [Bacteroidales bacterium]
MKAAKLILAAVTAVLFSCNQPNGYVIQGNLTGFPDSTMIYLRNMSSDETFDSALIINHQFELKGVLENVPEQIWLNTRIDNKLIYKNLLIGNEKIKVTGDIKDFPFNVQISGSKTQKDFDDLQDLTKSLEIQRDSLVQSYFRLSPEIQGEKGKEIGRKIRLIDDSIQKIRIEYVKSHTNAYPAVINLGYLKSAIPKDTVRVLYENLTNELKSSKYAKIVEVYLNEKISEVGDHYHDFEAFNKTGDKINFSDLIEKTGKYILLDFTTTHCGPCIQAAEELRTIHQTYSDSLTIVSFSCDAKKEWWLKSLDRDSVSWVGLWDGKGTYSETYIKYGVWAFPSFFLINPHGKIISKWVGYNKGSLVNSLTRFQNNKQ